MRLVEFRDPRGEVVIINGEMVTRLLPSGKDSTFVFLCEGRRADNSNPNVQQVSGTVQAVLTKLREG